MEMKEVKHIELIDDLDIIKDKDPIEHPDKNEGENNSIHLEIKDMIFDPDGDSFDFSYDLALKLHNNMNIL